MVDVSAAVRADDTSVRWWEPLVAFIGGNVIAIVIITAMLLGAMMRGFSASDATQLLTANFAGIMGSVILSDIIIAGLAWWLVQRRTGWPLAAYFPDLPLRMVLMAAAGGVVLSLVANGGNQLIDAAGWVHFTDTPTERAMVPHSAVQWAVSLFTVSLRAPFAEELVLRGVLLRWLIRARVVGAILISGVAFGLIHGQFYQHPGAQGVLLTVELTIIGIVLGLLALRTGSLRSSFAMHAGFNLTATILSVVWS